MGPNQTTNILIRSGKLGHGHRRMPCDYRNRNQSDFEENARKDPPPELSERA